MTCSTQLEICIRYNPSHTSGPHALRSEDRNFRGGHHTFQRLIHTLQEGLNATNSVVALSVSEQYGGPHRDKAMAVVKAHNDLLLNPPRTDRKSLLKEYEDQPFS